MTVFIGIFIFLLAVYAYNKWSQSRSEKGVIYSGFDINLADVGDEVTDGVYVDVCDAYYARWSKKKITSIYAFLDFPSPREIFIYPYSLEKFFFEKTKKIIAKNPIRKNVGSKYVDIAIENNVLVWIRGDLALIIVEGNLLKEQGGIERIREYRDLSVQIALSCA